MHCAAFYLARSSAACSPLPVRRVCRTPRTRLIANAPGVSTQKLAPSPPFRGGGCQDDLRKGRTLDERLLTDTLFI